MLNLLIIDTDVALTPEYQRVLEAHGFQVAVAANPQEAFQLLRQIYPAGVLLELLLPGGSGLPLLREIRRQFPALPILTYTHLCVPDLVQAAESAGATAVYSKAEITPLKMVEAFRYAIARSYPVLPQFA